MTERLYLDHPDVYIVADYDDALGGGRALRVVCESPHAADYAATLAAALNVPLQHAPGPGQPSGPGPARAA